ncbi:MAG TPA: DUF3109 family protein [Luteibaculaceae bacterium]|nr:DUF3109 family protein [Luteibaculaceae bacterium]
MVEIENTLVSLDVFTEEFVCDLSACKGACCVLGDAGAPLDEEETAKLEDIIDEVSPFLRPEGRDAIAQQGAFVIEADGTYATPLVDGKECAYTVFQPDGTALCGIEAAYRAGATHWKKPISCELYPIRLNPLKDHIALNYHRWNVCAPACQCGAKMKVPVYRFLKDALTRKFGADYYTALEAAKEYIDQSHRA